MMNEETVFVSLLCFSMGQSEGFLILLEKGTFFIVQKAEYEARSYFELL